MDNISHEFSFRIWYFRFTLSFPFARYIERPKWLGLLFCKFGKHDWFLVLDGDYINFEYLTYMCNKCKQKITYSVPIEFPKE